MIKNKESFIIREEAVIASRIIHLREVNVILDFHLAGLYEVETRALKQAVRRNTDRFPEDFMFELTDNEINEVVSQNVIPSKKHFGGAHPFAFTENGVAMLSSVLTSKKAIEISIVIMRTFTMLRKLLLSNKNVLHEIEEIKKSIVEQDQHIKLIFQYLKGLEETERSKIEHEIRKRVGYKRKDER